MTLICVPVMGTTCEEMCREVEAAARSGADLIELRLDFITQLTGEQVAELISTAKRHGKPLVATCRSAAEGGKFTGPDADLVDLLHLAGALIQEGYVDLELERWRASDRARALVSRAQGERPGTRFIFSKHDFQGTPTDLDAAFAELQAAPADVVKLACKAECITDSLRMLDVLHREAPARPAIALSMGEAGILTRVLARKFGALLTFAAVDSGKESAPGQPSVRDLRELYRWNSIQVNTKVYGVIGCPVAHSMSPAIHNAAFGSVGCNGVYLPLRVEPSYEAFEAFLDGCLARPWLDLRGLSVTIPHKENLLRYVETRGGEIDPLTRRIGVANTLLIEPRRVQGESEAGVGARGSPSPENSGSDYSLRAFNTDYRGALDALCAGLRCDPQDLDGVHVAVLGAGGVSRAIVAGLRDSGCRVTIYNRTGAKAAALAADFGAATLPWDQRVRPDTEVIINCTSIGMWPEVEETPLERFAGGRSGIVFDTVYNPIETRLLREARQAGQVTIDGVAMFVGQAAAQFEHWTRHPAPRELMRAVVLQRLSGPP